MHFSLSFALICFLGFSQSYFINKKTISILFPEKNITLYPTDTVDDHEAEIAFFEKNTPNELALNLISSRDFVDGRVYLEGIFSLVMCDYDSFQSLYDRQDCVDFNIDNAIKDELDFISNYVQILNQIEDLTLIQAALYHHSVIAA